MKARFDELLPFYVNGTLSEADRAYVEDYLREHPAARAELSWYESLQRRLHEDAPPVSSEVGLERALQRIRTEGPLPQRSRQPAAPTLFERLRDWLSSLVPQPMLRPALAVALAVVAVQAALIGSFVSRSDETSELRALQLRGAAVEKGPYLKLNFKPDAREADIRMLLVEVHGNLAAGPGQLGDYYVHVPEQQLQAVTDKLAASSIVEAVAVVDALPAHQ